MKKRDTKPDIRLIYAMDLKNGIGQNGQIPWTIKADLTRFSQLTKNSTVVMGSKTWDSLPPQYRPLPNRINIVTTRKKMIDSIDKYTDDTFLFSFNQNESDEQARQRLLTFLDHFPQPVWVIGGQYLFKLLLPVANTVERTIVYNLYSCDRFAPVLDLNEWTITDSKKVMDHNPPYEFETLKRKSK